MAVPGPVFGGAALRRCSHRLTHVPSCVPSHAPTADSTVCSPLGGSTLGGAGTAETGGGAGGSTGTGVGVGHGADGSGMALIPR